MRIVQPSFQIIDHNNLLRNIELGGRVCYKSEDKMGPGSDIALIDKLKNFKHESVFEHGVITVKFVTDRGVTHELVRHRLAAYSQESTRYCNYSKDKYDNQITVIDPFFFDPNEPAQEVMIPTACVEWNDPPILVPSETGTAMMNSFDVWMLSCLWAEWGYTTLTTQFKRSAQEARSVLPNSLKTEIQVTANVREWRHILTLRAHRDAHPQIRQIMVPLAHELSARWPSLFAECAGVAHTHPANQLSEGDGNVLLCGDCSEK